MKFLVPLALAGLLLAIAVAATVRLSSSSELPPDPVRGARTRPGTGPGVADARLPAPESWSSTTSTRISMRLDELRAQAELRGAKGEKPTPGILAEEEGRRREVAELLENLKDHLLAHPEAWPDVVSQLSSIKSLMVVLEMSALLCPVVDESVEALLLRILKKEDRVMARRAAVALLAESPSPEALRGFVEAVQMDEDSGVRYAAFLQMMRRKQDPAFQAYATPMEETLRKQCAVEPDLGVRELMARFLPGNAPLLPQVKPRHRGGPKAPLKPAGPR